MNLREKIDEKLATAIAEAEEGVGYEEFESTEGIKKIAKKFVDSLRRVSDFVQDECYKIVDFAEINATETKPTVNLASPRAVPTATTTTAARYVQQQPAAVMQGQEEIPETSEEDDAAELAMYDKLDKLEAELKEKKAKLATMSTPPKTKKKEFRRTKADLKQAVNKLQTQITKLYDDLDLNDDAPEQETTPAQTAPVQTAPVKPAQQATRPVQQTPRAQQTHPVAMSRPVSQARPVAVRQPVATQQTTTPRRSVADLVAAKRASVAATRPAPIQATAAQVPSTPLAPAEGITEGFKRQTLAEVMSQNPGITIDAIMTKWPKGNPTAPIGLYDY